MEQAPPFTLYIRKQTRTFNTNILVQYFGIYLYMQAYVSQLNKYFQSNEMSIFWLPKLPTFIFFISMVVSFQIYISTNLCAQYSLLFLHLLIQFFLQIVVRGYLLNGRTQLKVYQQHFQNVLSLCSCTHTHTHINIQYTNIYTRT